MLQDIKKRYPNESIFKIFLGLTAFIFICDAGESSGIDIGSRLQLASSYTEAFAQSKL